MNGEMLQRIIEEVISRLQRRAESTATLSISQLREADSRALFCQYAALHIVQADLPSLTYIAEQDVDDPVAKKVHDALASGIRLQISLHHRLLPSLPVKKLARLPIRLVDERGQTICLHPTTLLSYADVALLAGQLLVLRRRCVVTALAREAASARNIQLIKQE
ncbi:microcompartment protein PduM [Citrobacter sp. CK184]|uniref:microcompartment protein PduM n=1 Tax=Citrobacter TaxID=544 RepID=UPI0018E16AB4|nr:MULTISPECIES: microcompartment protein PduM [Citrobacter]MBI0676338.1 microcompartment protein PduM [Citrobacter koseri]MBJ8804673.1 microcompartment protein PduM [Citrobacter koseri]MDE9577680.1 microcompartment protein PduM [Citrobacter koseri]MDM3031015.1 microcompartment protein PduM [Citrobacter sp. CK185]MDM3046240.1 microcompartment protein PduM [Citrobacter sp. CK184]